MFFTVCDALEAIAGLPLSGAAPQLLALYHSCVLIGRLAAQEPISALVLGAARGVMSVGWHMGHMIWQHVFRQLFDDAVEICERLQVLEKLPVYALCFCLRARLGRQDASGMSDPASHLPPLRKRLAYFLRRSAVARPQLVAPTHRRGDPTSFKGPSRLCHIRTNFYR